MIELDLEQGTNEWLDARYGVPTASNFHRIVTRTGKLSSQATDYMNELLAEWLFREPVNDFVSGFMERGSRMEEEAFRFYDMMRDTQPRRAGLVLVDDRKYGCSPDAIAGESRGVEIKTPKATTHIAMMMGDQLPDKHRCQIQGSLLVTGFDGWDFLSYNPDLPPVLVPVDRDEKFIELLDARVTEFCVSLDHRKKLLLERGCEPRPSPFPDPRVREVAA